MKLLRFLETGRFRRLGGVSQLTANVRVVAASNRPLESLIEGGGFRRDLFFRLAVVTLEVPSLRERRDDVPLLAEHFMRRAALETGCRVTAIEPAAVAALSEYEWPGNVRELRNAIESAVILSDGNVLRVRDLPGRILVAGRPGGESAAGQASPTDPSEAATLAEVERRHIEAMLQRFEGHRDRTARALGIATKTLYRKLREYEMSK